MRLVTLGVCLPETRDCAVALRLQRLDLPLRHVDVCLRAGECRLLLLLLRRPLLRVLNGARAGSRQILVALGLLLGVGSCL